MVVTFFCSDFLSCEQIEIRSKRGTGRIALYGLVARSGPKECPRYLNCCPRLWYINFIYLLIHICAMNTPKCLHHLQSTGLFTAYAHICTYICIYLCIFICIFICVGQILSYFIWKSHLTQDQDPKSVPTILFQLNWLKPHVIYFDSMNDWISINIYHFFKWTI